MPASSSAASTATASRPAWVDDLFACIDRRDAKAFGDFVTDNARFRFGNAPAVTGRDEIVAAVAQFFEAIAGLRHSVELVLRASDNVVCKGEVIYTRLDGSSIKLPFATVFEMDGGLIDGYLIYSDLNPLWNATTS